MNSLTFIKDYRDNDTFRASFNELAKTTFNIDFEPWYQKGFWNDRYVCYSFLDGGKIVANVSVSKMEMMIKGELKQAIQIGTVMTHPDYRKQGLSGRLMTNVIEEYELGYDLFFLFSDEDVSPFYQKFGFTQITETQFSVAVQSSRQIYQPRQLDLQKDKQMILDYYGNTQPSYRFDIQKGEHVLGFYGVHGFGNHFYYLDALDTVVLYQTKENTLHLYGVFTDQDILFKDLMDYFATEKITEVVFHFTPNFKDLLPEAQPLLTTDDIFHVRTAGVSFPNQFKFPLIAHA
ncbi:GNAT family N-acetyltransferase [Anaerobacillus isosaccharinicus]|uniref:GNAT family N-acetyltransferase n=1 Tax=Anaerobacillus isosaccharinicus TaxID=1532552 RepID=A0A1S2KX31_9BACI|nr:GNAT family N-acetyltransferase [Anaerobacillus isosaccharinicus]MBA5586784.1 GNAT family N-acetyltransferase [Anaerobacillus isosaccharinicus]QOY34998.1 GNAT family N-acetyltransferase [Anaerobacillus isosaccharinicus]